MKFYIGSCISPDLKILKCKNLDDLACLIEDSEEITKENFLQECKEAIINSGWKSLLYDINNHSNDFSFFKNGNIFFFEHSAIEHFFK